MRYIQDPKTYKLIPAHEYYDQPESRGVAIFVDDVKPFISPVDGSVVTTRRGLNEHNKRNNVVPAETFDAGHYKQKADERADFYQGTTKTHSGKKLREDRKQDVINVYNKHKGL